MKRFSRAAATPVGAVAILFAIVFVALASEQARPPAEQKTAPKILFQELEHDFGKVGPDQTVKHTFKFSNKGKDSLVIGDIKTTCGCTGTLISQRQISPNEEGSLEVSFHSGQSGGQRRKSIFVNSNDPETPSVKLDIIANVVVPVEVRPRTLYWVAERNEKAVRTIDFLYSSDLRLKIKSLQVSSPAFTASYRPTSQPREPGYQIDLKYDGSLPIGNFNEKLTITTDNEQYSKFDVTLRGKVVGPIKVIPDAIALGVVKEEQLPVRTIRIYDTSKNDFKIVGVESTSPLINFELNQNESNQYEIKVSLTQEPPAGPFSEKLSIQTNDPADPVIEVPVFAYVK